MTGTPKSARPSMNLFPAAVSIVSSAWPLMALA
jgi:hypothetical protein